ncbi:hypothetical protein HDF14_004015 [Edaphobacter lichenicola]|uniref:Uncharacterized protein n=1 Tax=Tunturiibacter gelidiferens TaxID=3069689 RepID=A0A9X0QHD5_9BACT|nr:hypothetical protein [Edaphobacter lichenicola]
MTPQQKQTKRQFETKTEKRDSAISLESSKPKITRCQSSYHYESKHVH